MRKLCLFLFLLCNTILLGKEMQETLAIDLGGTRVKAAVFPSELTWEGLKEIKTYSFSSREWLSEKLPDLLVKSPNNPLSTLIGRNCRKIAISVPGPVLHGREYIDTYHKGVPFKLKKACEKVVHQSVDIENDAVTWMHGYRVYKKLKGEEIHYPSLVAIIGTGLGIGILENETTMYKIETSLINCPFTKLKQASKTQLTEVHYDRWKPRYSLGKTYFEWVFKGEAFEDDQMKPHLDNYNQRFEAFIEDLIAWSEESLRIKITGLVVGGGYSRFITMPQKRSLVVDLESPPVFEAEGISPDLIQLMGYNKQEREKIQVKFYPSLEEILLHYQKQ